MKRSLLCICLLSNILFISAQSTIHCTVLTPDGHSLEGVQIFDQVTDADGKATISFNVSVPSTFSWDISYSDQAMDCITLSDYYAMTEHILAIKPVSATEIVASDLNQTNSVTTLDAYLLNKAIEENGFPSGHIAWNFTSPNDVYGGLPEIQVTGNNDSQDIQILAIKKGNSDGNYDCSFVSSVQYHENKSEVVVSPNPAFDHILVQKSEDSDWVRVLSLQGQELISPTMSTTIFVDHLAAGMYVVQVNGNNGQQSILLVKN